MSLEDLKEIPYGKTAIELKNISLAFGGVKALTDVSFEVKKGEVFAIIGPNGAGKSSMLNVINGFYKPTSGIINFAGTDRSEMEPELAAKSGIARTFQNIALFKGMSTLDNLMTGRLLKQKKNFLMQALYFGPVANEEEEHGGTREAWARNGSNQDATGERCYPGPSDDCRRGLGRRGRERRARARQVADGEARPARRAREAARRRLGRLRRARRGLRRGRGRRRARGAKLLRLRGERLELLRLGRRLRVVGPVRAGGRGGRRGRGVLEPRGLVVERVAGRARVGLRVLVREHQRRAPHREHAAAARAEVRAAARSARADRLLSAHGGVSQRRRTLIAVVRTRVRYVSEVSISS